MATTPLLVFDTNILMDVLLGRDGAAAVLLVQLAEQKRIELVVPEYVLSEFRGTALRWTSEELEKLKTVRSAAKEWKRLLDLDQSAGEIQSAASTIEAKLGDYRKQIDEVIARVSSVARVPPHTMEVHFRGDLRYLAGRPPDRPVDGLKDCRIYEAVLDIARTEQSPIRPKFLVTRDSDFDMKEFSDELEGLGFKIRKDPGRIYGEFRV